MVMAETKEAETESNLDWNEWQLLDSILPTGGFAHSLGVESACQTHFISSHEDLHNFIISLLENTASLLLPFVLAAASEPPTATSLHRLNQTLDATLTNEVARKASASQGSALMRVAAAVFSYDVPALKDLRLSATATGNFHHAVAFGVVCGAIGMGGDRAQRAYVFVTLRDTLSAATRLNVVGPLGAAVMQRRIGGVAERIMRKWMGRRVEDACLVAPLLETLQGCHTYLFSRLFSS